MNDNELKHYGVLGMKWGVRRFNKKVAKGKTISEEDRKKNRLRVANIHANTNIDADYHALKFMKAKSYRKQDKLRKKIQKLIRTTYKKYGTDFSVMDMNTAMANQVARHKNPNRRFTSNKKKQRYSEAADSSMETHNFILDKLTVAFPDKSTSIRKYMDMNYDEALHKLIEKGFI